MASASPREEISSAVISPAAPHTIQSGDAPTHPELSKGTWSKRYGRYDFERFDNVSQGDALVGGACIGNVHVDCNLLFAESQWGVLEEADAGIVYIDFRIQQPENYVLQWAKVEVTLEDLSESPSDLPAQITPYYGPRRVVGPESTKAKTERVSIDPRFEIMGVAGGGLGSKDFETTFQVPCRWEFTGTRVCRDGKGKRVYTGLHRTLEWSLKENELDPGQQNLVKTAFTFARDGNSFLMKIKVRGGLRGRLNRIKAKFAPERNGKNGISVTKIGPYLGPARSLDRLASDLDKVMEMKNQQLIALELPRPQPAMFLQMHDRPSTEGSQGQTEATEHVPAQGPSFALPLPPSSSLQAVLSPAPALVQIEAAPPITTSSGPQSRTDPTLENLSSMAELFMRLDLQSIREGALSIPLENPSTVTTLPDDNGDNGSTNSTGSQAEASAVTLPATPETDITPTPTTETTAVEAMVADSVALNRANITPTDDEIAMLQEALATRIQKLRGALLGVIFQPPQFPAHVWQRLYRLIKWPKLIYRLILRVLFGI